MDDIPDRNWLSFLIGRTCSASTSGSEVIRGNIPICYKMADFYNIKHKKRGVALIFNHEIFDDKSITRRKGTEKDKNDFEKVLSKLDFEVRIYDDKKYAEITKILRAASEENYSEHDCILVCVMSHGEDGKINARDHTYRPDILWEAFTNCVTLAGKPKLFFIQACRGDKVDDGIRVRDTDIETDSSMADETYMIPAMADFLIMYSTYQGFYSWRSPDNGSWFIQALCHELEERHTYLDLLTILTFVNRRVAVLHESNCTLEKALHKKKQICTIVSMLTRLFAFVPKRDKMELEGTVESNAAEIIQLDNEDEQKIVN